MSDDAIRLRPVQDDDFPELNRFLTDPETVGPFQWTGWTDPRAWRRRWEENGMLSDDGGVLAIVSGGGDDGARLGIVGWRKVVNWRTSFSWNMGAQLFPAFRGRGAGTGAGTRAQRLLVEYLFAHTIAHRVEADTEAENVAERRALEKAGFTFEGIMRGFAFRDGKWRDAARYGVLRDDLLPGSG
ncbi:GNAT family N-acetyltransferase [Streptomyces sp. CA-181903]|uniref:GNAT family N-acetyltransferase n=1 Tax=Streptomyces sp. CA-181903 TaxID=3240055 RepID=UPI003D8EB880